MKRVKTFRYILYDGLNTVRILELQSELTQMELRQYSRYRTVHKEVGKKRSVAMNKVIEAYRLHNVNII